LGGNGKRDLLFSKIKLFSMTINERVAALQAAMKAHKIDAYIIPSSDPHQSEYVADHWKTREWISGFTGSAGTVVVTADHAGLWTDSRYFIQAEEQLKGTCVTLHKLNVPHTPEHREWLKQQLPDGSKIGMDGRLFAAGTVRALAQFFYDKKFVFETETDLIKDIWKNRPTLPKEPVFEHAVKYSGANRTKKLQAVRAEMKGASHYLISTLDDIAWLFNLRGGDVECNPVFYAYAVIGKDKAWLFIDKSKVPDKLVQKLNKDGVILKPYTSLEGMLSKLPKNSTVLIDKGSTSNRVFNAIDKDRIKNGANIVAPLKAIKNKTEIEHCKQVMVKDGVALVKLFRWLENTLEKRPVPEIEVADQLIEFRRAQGNYFGESFHAIVGYEGNGAIVHYRPEAGKCANIKNKGMLLLDCGGQYLDGTTDITRTVSFSRPTQEQKTDFTLVLKGHIALALAKFPIGTTGVQLDTLARMHLWQHQYNYGHGTGHGVGFFLNVHEPPQGFSPVPHTPRANVTFEPGMLTSNEPGLYKAGKYGIRTENLVLCVKDGEGEFGEFLRFETITLFPIDLSLVAKSLMTKEEKTWLNAYHEEVFEKLSPHLDKAEKEWLRKKCGSL
jgi:Xaa-Pro aminopeptidase